MRRARVTLFLDLARFVQAVMAKPRVYPVQWIIYFILYRKIQNQTKSNQKEQSKIKSCCLGGGEKKRGREEERRGEERRGEERRGEERRGKILMIVGRGRTCAEAPMAARTCHK